MESRKENLKGLFSNTRTRVILIFTFTVLIIGVLIALFRFQWLAGGETLPEANISSLPAQIQSIPGQTNQTAQYAKLQQEANEKQATQAMGTGNSAIPTIIETHAFGGEVESIKSPGSVGFVTLSKNDQSGQKSVWYDLLKQENCSKQSVDKAIGKGASLSDLRQACDCKQLQGFDYALKELLVVCTCPELRETGLKVDALKSVGLDASNLKKCGFSSCEMRNAGYTTEQLKQAGYSEGELKGAGYSDVDIARTSLPPGMTVEDVRKAGCDASGLTQLKEKGVTAAVIRQINRCSAAQVKAVGFTTADLKSGGYTPEQLRQAGYAAAELKAAGFTDAEIASATLPAGMTLEDIRKAGCDLTALTRLREKGATAAIIHQTNNCTATQVKAAGFSVADLKNGGYTAAELKAAGVTANDLVAAGYTEKELTDVGVAQRLPGQDTALPGSSVEGLPDMPGSATIATRTTVVTAVPSLPRNEQAQAAAVAAVKLQAIAQRQNKEMEAQRHRQEIQDRSAAMAGAANAALQSWRAVSTQAYVGGNNEDEVTTGTAVVKTTSTSVTRIPGPEGETSRTKSTVVRTGDVLFAVVDTTVNSDEPSPILATIVSGALKGSKLIGNFTIPPNGDKLVIMFNTLSIPGAPRTSSISAYAIDADTARTALASRVDHHYLSRYGSLFAATFIEGFGNAFQSANTTVTIGGTGGGDNITVQNGIGRSTLQNAVIALATVGKNFGQIAMQNVNRPATVEVFSGTGVGVLFTQDVTVRQ